MPNGNDKLVSRQLQRHIARENAKHGKQNIQAALNNLLWKIAMNHGGMIDISRYELDQIPSEAALQTKFDSITNKLIVIAGTRPNKDGIFVAQNEVIVT